MRPTGRSKREHFRHGRGPGCRAGRARPRGSGCRPGADESARFAEGSAEAIPLQPPRRVGRGGLRVSVLHPVAGAAARPVPGFGRGHHGSDRLRDRSAGRPCVAGVRGPSGPPAAGPVVASVPDRRAGPAADFVPARAAVAGSDPGPDGRRSGGVGLEAAGPCRRGIDFRRSGGRRTRHSTLLLVGGTLAGPVDGVAGRARPRLGAGRRRDRRPGQWGAAGRGHRGDGSDLRGPGRHDQRHRGPADHPAAVGWAGFPGRLGHPGVSGSQLRRAGSDGGRDRLVHRHDGAGTDPRLRGDRVGRACRGSRPVGGRRSGTRRWVRPVVPAGRRDHRDRLGGPGRIDQLRVRDRRRLGGGRDPVLVPAVVGVVPGRPGTGRGSPAGRCSTPSTRSGPTCRPSNDPSCTCSG